MVVDLRCSSRENDNASRDAQFFSGDGLAAVRERAIHLGYTPSEMIAHPPKPAHFTVMDPDGMMVEFSV